MRRREFMSLLGSLGAWSMASHAQVPKLHRVGVMVVGGATATMTGPQPSNPYSRALLDGMRDLGYVYGEHFVTEPRGGDATPEKFPGLVSEMVALNPNVIVAAGPLLSLLTPATSTIPIIMAASPDPVEEGSVASLTHPERNFTGLSLQSLDIVGKRLELLKELVPGSEAVAVIWDRLSRPSLSAAEASAKARGWTLLPIEIRDPAHIEASFKEAVQKRASAILVFAGGHLSGRARQVAEIANRNQLPTMYDLRPYTDAGGLMSYSANLIEIWRRAATYVDKVLKGAKPADLPVEQPRNFELVVNLRTARALGIAVPPSLLARADEVIE
jgi:putative tryptophan/tyrosine transport system substrate-binding protein